MTEEPKQDKPEVKRNMAITPIMNSGMTLIPSEWEWNSIEKQMKMLAKVGMLPKKFYGTTQKPRTEEQAIIAACNCAMSGREMGIAPRTSLRLFNYIDDEESLGVQGMLSQIYSRCKEARINFKTMTVEKCVIEAKRYADDKMQEFSFSIEEAKTEIKGYNDKNPKTGEWKKPNWHSMPKKMLKARAVSDMAHSLFSDVINGIYTDEEVADFTTTEVPIGDIPQYKKEAIPINIPLTTPKVPTPPPTGGIASPEAAKMQGAGSDSKEKIIPLPKPAPKPPQSPIKDAEVVSETKKEDLTTKTQVVGFARRANVPKPPVADDGIPENSDDILEQMENDPDLKQPSDEDK